MRIDPTKVGDAKIFRTWGWTVARSDSEYRKETLELAGFTGMKTKQVTGPSAISTQEREHDLRLIELRELAGADSAAFGRTLERLGEEAISPIAVGGSWPARRQL